jgi:Flp pilus assembly protein TadG
VSRLRNDRGVALVEFALVAPLLMMLLFGMLDFGRALNYWIDETHLANMGARMAVVENWPTEAPPTSQTLQDYIREQAHAGELKENVTVCITLGSGGPAEGEPVTVTVSLPTEDLWSNFLVNELGFGPETISAHSTMRLEKNTQDYEDVNPPGCP